MVADRRLSGDLWAHTEPPKPFSDPKAILRSLQTKLRSYFGHIEPRRLNRKLARIQIWQQLGPHSQSGGAVGILTGTIYIIYCHWAFHTASTAIFTILQFGNKTSKSAKHSAFTVLQRKSKGCPWQPLSRRKAWKISKTQGHKDVHKDHTILVPTSKTTARFFSSTAFLFFKSPPPS